MGCTATTVYVWSVGRDRYLQCANVGDSTAFLWYVFRFCFFLVLSCSYVPGEDDGNV